MDTENKNQDLPAKEPAGHAGDSAPSAANDSKRKWFIMGGLIVALGVASALFFASDSNSDLQGNVRSRGGRVTPPPTRIVIDEKSCQESNFFVANEKACTTLFEELEATTETTPLQEETTPLPEKTTLLPEEIDEGDFSFSVSFQEEIENTTVALGTITVSSNNGGNFSTLDIGTYSSNFTGGSMVNFLFTATDESFLINTLTVENNSDESNSLANDDAIQMVRLHYSKYLGVSGSYGTGWVWGDTEAPLINGRATFTGLSLLVPFGADPLMPPSTPYAGVQVLLNPLGQGSNAGDQIEFDFPIDGAFSATGLTSGAVITSVENTADVDGPAQTLTVPAPAAPAAPPAAPAGSGSY